MAASLRLTSFAVMESPFYILGQVGETIFLIQLWNQFKTSYEGTRVFEEASLWHI
jgi:hypothetical protein